VGSLGVGVSLRSLELLWIWAPSNEAQWDIRYTSLGILPISTKFGGMEMCYAKCKLW
jgi:hypothetical protein